MFTIGINCLPICLLIVTIVFLPGYQCWPSGAPENACTTLSPGHGANQGKPASASPFVVTQSHLDYKPGESVQVVVKASEPHSFRGMLIQAYDPATGQTIGKFQPGRGLKTLDSCSSVTHSDRRGKRSATLLWDSPVNGQGSGKVVFRGTVVQRYSEFFEGIESILSS